MDRETFDALLKYANITTPAALLVRIGDWVSSLSAQKIDQAIADEDMFTRQLAEKQKRSIEDGSFDAQIRRGGNEPCRSLRVAILTMTLTMARLGCATRLEDFDHFVNAIRILHADELELVLWGAGDDAGNSRGRRDGTKPKVELLLKVAELVFSDVLLPRKFVPLECSAEDAETEDPEDPMDYSMPSFECYVAAVRIAAVSRSFLVRRRQGSSLAGRGEYIL